MIHSLSPSWHCNGRSDFTDTVTAREPYVAEPDDYPIPTRTASFHALGWLAMAMLFAVGLSIVIWDSYARGVDCSRTKCLAAFVAAGDAP